MRAFLAVALLFLLRDESCGGPGSASGQVNAPCTRNGDCEGKLRCAAGVCTDPDLDSGSPDGGTDAETGGG
ncbi:MAG: hypothetical protein HOO96_21855 [Polyangiaceae bacterium]|nr:hypothetical protein [Polyangiaceae bacterium]